MLGKQKIKYIQSLGQKKQRDIDGVFIAEGPKIVDELLSSVPSGIVECYATKKWFERQTVTGRIPVTEISEDELTRISQLQTPHEVLVVARKFERNDSPRLKGQISLALDAIRDPGNMGTIIRIADWFGVENVICSEDCADIYNSKVVQATMGSIARVNVIYTDLPAFISAHQDLRVYAAALEGISVTAMKPLAEGIIVVGNESKGINPDLLDLVNEKITIPKKGKAESLNAAVAAGIILSRLVT